MLDRIPHAPLDEAFCDTGLELAPGPYLILQIGDVFREEIGIGNGCVEDVARHSHPPVVRRVGVTAIQLVMRVNALHVLVILLDGTVGGEAHAVGQAGLPALHIRSAKVRRR